MPHNWALWLSGVPDSLPSLGTQPQQTCPSSLPAQVRARLQFINMMGPTAFAAIVQVSLPYLSRKGMFGRSGIAKLCEAAGSGSLFFYVAGVGEILEVGMRTCSVLEFTHADMWSFVSLTTLVSKLDSDYFHLWADVWTTLLPSSQWPPPMHGLERPMMILSNPAAIPPQKCRPFCGNLATILPSSQQCRDNDALNVLCFLVRYLGSSFCFFWVLRKSPMPAVPWWINGIFLSCTQFND